VAGYDACAFLKRREGLSCATSPLRHQATDPTTFLGIHCEKLRTRYDMLTVFSVTSGYTHAATSQLGMQLPAALPVQVGGAPPRLAADGSRQKSPTLETRNQTKDDEWRTTLCLRLTARRNPSAVFNVESLGERGHFRAASLLGSLAALRYPLDDLIKVGFLRDQH
jgi:hypothetical protein